MSDVVIKYSTSGLGDTLKSFDQVAQAQKSLEQFLKAASKAYQAQGQDVKQASQSAKEFAAANNITAQSFQQLIARQKEVDLGAKAIAQTLKLQAQVTKELEQANKQLASSIGDTGSKLNAVKEAFNGNAKAAKDAVDAYKQLASQGVSTVQAFSELNSKFGVTASQFKTLQSNVETSKQSFTGFNGVIVGVTSKLTEFAVELGRKVFIDFPKEAINIAASFDGIQRGLNAVSGGSKEGAKNFEFVKAEAQRLGLGLQGAESSFLRLVAAARGTALAGKPIQEVFTAVAASGRVLGSTTAQTEQALVALEQMISKGTVSSQELKLQLGNALPGAFEIAARSMGKTTAEFTKFVETGSLTAEEFLPKFAAQLKKELGDGVAEASEGAAANLQKVANIGAILAQSFGNELLPVLNKFLGVIGENSNELERFAGEAGKVVVGGLELLFNIFKFGVDNAGLLKVALETLALAFIGLKVAAAIEGVQAFITLLPVAIELVGGTTAAVQILQASLIGVAVPLAALAVLVADVELLKLSKDIENAATELESLRVGTDELGKTSLQLANHTKALNAELEKKGRLSKEDIDQAKRQINTNNQILDGLAQQLKAAKNTNAVTEEQKNAKAANIAEINNEIKALNNQNEALIETVKREKESGTAKALTKGQIKDKTAEIKKETQALKEAAKVENERKEAAIKRSEEDAKIAAKKAEDQKETAIKDKGDNAEAVIKKQTEKEIEDLKKANEKELAIIQADNEKQTQATKLAFERNTLTPLKQQNERLIQAETKKFNDQENAAKLKFNQQINAENDRVSAARTARDSKQNENFSAANRLLEIQSTTDANTKASLEKQQQVANTLKSIDLTKTLDAQGILNLAKQLTGISDTTVKTNADTVKNAISQIEAAQKEQLKAKDTKEDEERKARQQEQERQFNAQQSQEKLDFEQNVLQPLKTQLQQQEQDVQIAFENDVLKPLKLQQEEEINAKKLEATKAEQAIKEEQEQKLKDLKKSIQAEIDASKEAFEANQRAIDRQHEDEKQKRTAEFNANQRALDEQSAERVKELKKTPSQAPTVAPTNTPERIKQQIQGRFTGGTVSKGEGYLVGEFEPEVVIPEADGVVLNQKQAYDNIRLLEKVGRTKFNLDAAMMNTPKAASDYTGILNELKSLRETVESRDVKAEFPVVIQDNDQGYRKLDQMMKLQFAVLRSKL